MYSPLLKGTEAACGGGGSDAATAMLMHWPAPLHYVLLRQICTEARDLPQRLPRNVKILKKASAGFAAGGFEVAAEAHPLTCHYPPSSCT